MFLSQLRSRRKIRRPNATTTLIVLTVLVSTCSVFTVLSTVAGKSRNVLPTRLIDAIGSRAGPDGWIVLAVVDDGYVDMALNFHEASLVAHGIDNFLFIGFGKTSCVILSNLNVPCFPLHDKFESDDASTYRTKQFNSKSHRRNNIILQALTAGYTVLYSDADVIFTQNPQPELKELTRVADIATQLDDNTHCSGFVVARPTAGARRLYTRMNQVVAAQPHRMDDQQAMNSVINKLNLTVVRLSPRRWASGSIYFGRAANRFAKNNTRREKCEDPKTCHAIIHNNFILGKAAKVYRFKEHLMWVHDEGGSYYGSETNEYLLYSNSYEQLLVCQLLTEKPPKPEDVKSHELKTLRTALAIGLILDRIVILPRFHCGSKCEECPLNALLDINRFDSIFSGRYRESTFLLHHKVPTSVKNGSSKAQSLLTTALSDRKNPTVIPEAAIRRSFGTVRDKILTLNALHGMSVEFAPSNSSKLFNAMLTNAGLGKA